MTHFLTFFDIGHILIELFQIILKYGKMLNQFGKYIFPKVALCPFI